MGIISTTRTIAYCMSAVLVTGCIGFTLNAYFLKLLQDRIQQLELEISALREEIAGNKKVKKACGKSLSESEEEDEEFHIALESIPSQSSIPAMADIACTDSRCDADLITLCRSIDEKHDTLKLTEQGCEQSLAYLREVNQQRPDTPQLIWRLVRIMFEEAKHNARAGLDAKGELLAALELAAKAVEVGESNSKCHLWYAILLGDTCKYDDTKLKLTKGMKFDEHVRISLKLDAYNSTALHLLGRYCYEVSGIKWWEAKIASTLFGTVPSSSYDEALQYFLSADELNSEWVENTIFIVKCLVALERVKEAKVWLARIKTKNTEHELRIQVEDLRRKL